MNKQTAQHLCAAVLRLARGVGLLRTTHLPTIITMNSKKARALRMLQNLVATKAPGHLYLAVPDDPALYHATKKLRAALTEAFGQEGDASAMKDRLIAMIAYGHVTVADIDAITDIACAA